MSPILLMKMREFKEAYFNVSKIRLRLFDTMI